MINSLRLLDETLFPRQKIQKISSPPLLFILIHATSKISRHFVASPAQQQSNPIGIFSTPSTVLADWELLMSVFWAILFAILPPLCNPNATDLGVY